MFSKLCKSKQVKEAASAFHKLRNPGARHITDSLLQLLSTISIKTKYLQSHQFLLNHLRPQS